MKKKFLTILLFAAASSAFATNGKFISQIRLDLPPTTMCETSTAYELDGQTPRASASCCATFDAHPTREAEVAIRVGLKSCSDDGLEKALLIMSQN